MLLALLAEVPGSPAAPALQQLVAQRRAARRAEKELERRATRPEELGLLPEYVRREEDGFRRQFMAVVGEELARQGPPKPLLAATADPARLVADRGLCLRVIDFLAARHRSRARTLAGLQQRILASSPAPPSPIAAADAGRHSSRKPQAKPRDDATGAGERVATPLQPQRPPSPLVLEPVTSSSSSSSSALRSADRRRLTSGSHHAQTPAGAVAALSSPLLRQGMRRLSLQGAAPLWSREGAEEEKGRDAVGMIEEAVAAVRSERRRPSSSKTPASKLGEDCGLQEVAQALHSEEALHVQQAKPRKSTNGGGSAVKGKGNGKIQEGGGMGLAEILPPVRRPEVKFEKKEMVREPPARAAVPAAAAAVSEGEEADEELRVENARLRAELQEVTTLYEALMEGGGGGGSGGNGGVDARVLAVVQQQNAMLAREAAALRGEVEGYRDMAEGATALLGGLEACLQELLAHAQQEEEGEGGMEGGGGSGGNRRRRRSGARASSSSSAASSAEFWAAALAETRQLHGRWRSVKRASRAKHQHGLLLPRDARMFLRRPAERVGAGGVVEEEEEDGPAAPVPLSGEWEDRARLRGRGAGDDEGDGQGLLDMERVRGLGGRLAGLVAALEQALEQARRPGLGADNTGVLLGPLLDQARALQLQAAQLGLAATAAGAAGVEGVTGARALLEAFDGLLVPRLRPQELKARVEGLRRLVMAERGALARGMATAVEEAVGLRRARGAAAGRGGRQAEEEDGAMEDEEGRSYMEEETEEAPVLDRRYSNGNGNVHGARRAMPSGVRPQWV